MSSPHAVSTATSPRLDTLDADPDVIMNIAPEPLLDDSELDFGVDGVKQEGFGMEGVEKNGLGHDGGLEEVEARIPLKKDVSLREFLGKMDEYAPIIPDAVTAHALTLAGLPPPPLSTHASSKQPTNPTPHTLSVSTAQPPSASLPPTTPLHLSRLLALATQKFIADIAADAYQYSRMRSGNMTSNSMNPAAGGVPGAPPANPSAGPSAIGAAGGGAAGGGGGAGSGGGGAGGGAGKEKSGTGAHVLGMQRAGFGGGGQGGGQGRTVLTMEDLGMAVGEYGVNVRRGEFYR